MNNLQDNVCYEGVFVRWDGELEPIHENILLLRTNSIESIIKKISTTVNVNGSINIYKKHGYNNENESKLHKVIQVYNNLELAYS